MDIVTIYWIMFFLGLVFAVVTAVFIGFGEAMAGHDVDFSGAHDVDLGAGVDTVDVGGADMGDMGDMGGAHVDLDTGDFFHAHGEVALNPVSPITIFSFLGGFGGGGLIGHYVGLTAWGTLFIALPVGFLVAFGIYYIMMVINRTNISSEARATEAVGVTAEIITPIVEDGTGEIAYVSRGSRYSAPARSIDAKSIGRGRAVKIWRIVGSTCYVKEIMPEEAEQPPTDPQDKSG
jgi:membrane protein implicated in regulation of membrane protease activity